MSYDRRTRDRFRVVVAGVTGGVGVAALTATGLLMGLASRDLADQQAEQQATQQAKQQAKPGQVPHARKQRAAERRAVREPRLRQRPQVTRTTVRYVTGDSNAVGSGGAVTSSPAAPAAQSAAQPAARPAAQPAPAPAPAPEPAPAPSSGS